MQQQQSVRSHQAAAGFEEYRQELGTDRLDHLDRHDPIEAAVDLAIVVVQDGDGVLEAGTLHASARELELCARVRRRDDLAAVVACDVDCKAAPAGADLEDPVPGS